MTAQCAGPYEARRPPFIAWRGRGYAAALALAAAACAPIGRPAGPPATGSHYVAMGSSFAAGPGITEAAEPKDRCGRSKDNYAHQLARSLGLRLTDVTCGGATTAHILGPWGELLPQIEAVTPDTSLVTITIGGNDVQYVGGLMWAACGGAPAGARDPWCREVLPASEATWQSLGSALRKIAGETRARAPNARILFVDYLAVLPPEGTCADIVMSADRAKASRTVAARLAKLTAQVAREAHIDVLRASEMSSAHSACAADAWTSGFPHPGGPKVVVPYHPTLAGMTAVARALERQLIQ